MDLSIKQFLALGLIPQITTAMWKKIGKTPSPLDHNEDGV